MMKFSKLELEVLKLLLHGDDDALSCLRNQLAGISIKERDFISWIFYDF